MYQKVVKNMLVSEIKPIGKVGKNLLENKNAGEIIKLIIEKPMQKACIACKNKNIETTMSSANRKNIMKKGKKRVSKTDVVELMNQNKTQTFLQAGKGYAWVMINYNTLSDENRKILFDLEENLGEDIIWFVKSCYVEFMNKLRKPLNLKPLVESFDDKYADKFKEKQLILMYNNKYPRRSVFIRMPIDENTTASEVETYFEEIINKLVKQ